jgi:filamentous hemagglutinin family protein
MRRLVLGVLMSAIALPAQAQNLVVPDARLGNEASIVEPRIGFDAIRGGATRGTGLFHSFSEFGVGDRAAVRFLVTPQIQNIFARVTGTGISNIQGSLGTRIDDAVLSTSTASLFLLNPNGIVFGPNAKLDLGGSFFATTASSFKFGEGREFSAVNPQAAPLLTVSAPIGLQFGEKVGAIAIEGAKLLPSTDAKSLSLIGGEVGIRNSTLSTISGQLDVGAVGADAFVGLVPLNIGWQADYGQVRLFRDVTIDRSQISSGARNVGDFPIFPINIQLQGQNITLTNSTFAYRYDNVNQPGLKPGAIKLDASQTIALNASNLFTDTDSSIDGASIILKADHIKLQDIEGKRSELFTTIPGNLSRRGGDIAILSNFLTIDGASIVTGTSSQGNAGNIKIDAAEQVSISAARVFPSRVYSSASKGSQGNTGDINIRTKNLFVTNGAYIALLASGQGRTGIIDIQASDQVVVTGSVLDKFPGSAGQQSYISNTQSSPPSPNGQQNNYNNSLGIKIQARSLLLEDGGKISTSIIYSNESKSIQIDAQDFVRIKGITKNPFIRSNSKPFFFNSEITSANLSGTGNSGDISIRSRSVEILGGGEISSSIININQIASNPFGNIDFQGKVGDITIEASDSVLVSGTSSKPIDPSIDAYKPSKISSDILVGNAQGGKISIKTGNLRLNEQGEISSSIYFGRGQAGEVDIEARGDITVVGSGKNIGPFSSIASSTTTLGNGNAGTVRLRAKSLNLIDGGAIIANTVGAGNAGNIFIDTQGDIFIAGISTQDVSSGITTRSVPLSSISQRRLMEAGFPVPGEQLGAGGNIEITGNTLRIFDDGLISARSAGQGAAGNIKINLRDRLIANNSNIRSTSTRTSGGNIDVAAKVVVLRNNSNIRSDSGLSASSGGNIQLQADGIVLLDDSDILAFAKNGRGGNISLLTSALLTRTYKPSEPGASLTALDTNGFVDINATGLTSGIITLPELNPLQNNRPEITPTLIDTDKVLSRSCLSRNPKTGKFYITGTGGLPLQPIDPPISTYSTLPVTTATTVAEADNLYKLPNGQIILAKACPASP